MSEGIFNQNRELSKDDIKKIFSINNILTLDQINYRKLLFNDEDPSVRRAVAENPQVAQFREYIYLFNDEDPSVRRAVAENPDATQFKEYRKLFNDED